MTQTKEQKAIEIIVWRLIEAVKNTEIKDCESYHKSFYKEDLK